MISLHHAYVHSLLRSNTPQFRGHAIHFQSGSGWFSNAFNKVKSTFNKHVVPFFRDTMKPIAIDVGKKMASAFLRSEKNGLKEKLKDSLREGKLAGNYHKNILKCQLLDKLAV